MKFASKTTIQSATREGVSFTIRILNEIQRAKLDLEILDKRVEYSELWAEIERLPTAPELIEGQPVPDDPDRIAREKLRIKAGLILSVHIKPATIRHGLLKIEGLELDDAPATVESLIESGPSELINEIWIAITREASLTAEQRKNLLSPSISAAPEGGTKSTTSADSAETTATT
jgi:hypothetical protein